MHGCTHHLHECWYQSRSTQPFNSAMHHMAIMSKAAEGICRARPGSKFLQPCTRLQAEQAIVDAWKYSLATGSCAITLDFAHSWSRGDQMGENARHWSVRACHSVEACTCAIGMADSCELTHPQAKAAVCVAGPQRSQLDGSVRKL